MKVYLFSYPEFFDGETKIVTALMECYDFVFHLRKPNSDENKYRQFLNAMPERFHQRIMLHDAYSLINEFKLKGLHFSKANRDMTKGVFDGAYKSTSCHSLDEVEAMRGSYNHLFISPVFPSISKKGYAGNIDLLELGKYVKSHQDLNIVALGGIDSTKMAVLKEMGFKSLALLGAIWKPHKLTKNDALMHYKEIDKCLN